MSQNKKKLSILLIEFLVENLPPNIIFKLLLYLIKFIIININNKEKKINYEKIKWFISSTRLSIFIYNIYIIDKKNNIHYINLKNKIIELSLKKTLENINIYFKSIIWNKYKNKFIRPIRNILILNNKKIKIIKINNIYSNYYTFSNKFNYKPIIIPHPIKYVSILYFNKLNVDYTIRKKIIYINIKKIANNKNIKIKINKNIINYLTFLIEWPTISYIKINKIFLLLPKEIFYYVIYDIFKCFASIYYKNNKLSPYIIIVSECISNKFYLINKNYTYNINNKFLDIQNLILQDRNYKLISYLPNLKKIVFQNKLGNLYQKIIRLQKIIKYIYNIFYILNKNQFINLIKFTCYFKNDLATKLVNEIPLLHNIVGIYYSKLEKLFIINKQFKDYYYFLKNINNNKKISCNLLSTSILILIDNIDTLLGILLIENNYLKNIFKNKDPYGIKKIILIIIKTILYNNIKINLNILINKIINIYILKFNIKINNIININNIIYFINNRYFNWIKNKNINLKIINSIYKNKYNKYYNKLLIIDNIINIFNINYNSNNFFKLIILYKRINNFLKKQNLIKLNKINNFSYKIVNIKLCSKIELFLYKFILKIYKKLYIFINKFIFNKIIYQLYKLYKPINKWLNNTYIINKENIIFSKNRLYLMLNIKYLMLNFINFEYLI